MTIHLIPSVRVLVRFSCGILDQKLKMKIWLIVWYATLVLFSAVLPFSHANGGGADSTQKDAIESSATLLTFFVTKLCSR